MYIEKCKVRAFDLDAGWKEDQGEIPCDVTGYTCGNKTLKALNLICDFDALKKFPKGIKVEYPEVLLDERYQNRRHELNDNVLASHRWFTQNYRLGNATPQKKLPEIADKDLTLQKYEATEINGRDIRRTNRNNRNNGRRR